MKEFFEGKNFRDESLVEIHRANRILEEYAAQGYDLTLRQLFYQLVARGLRENTPKSYKRLGDLIGKARMAGLTDWSFIVDRGRTTKWGAHFEDPADVIRSVTKWFKIDKWEDQPCHIEVMVEKDALSGVLEPVCRSLDVRFTANRGYSSLSHMYEIGKRICSKREEGKAVHVLYLGDHDPSGLDMDRDIAERLELFGEGHINFSRLALSMQQITELNPPENPTKLKDSRARNYIYQFGYSSWELDAIEPKHLTQLVRNAVADLRDESLWKTAIEKERLMIEELKSIADDYK